jgi:hypothetical protein
MGRACTPGADQTCNDDPRVSALLGTCDPAGQCVCSDGASINPPTGRCRSGNTCVAAAADDWAFRMTFDASDCAARTATTCPNAAFDARALESLWGDTCHFPGYLLVRVELAGGCATVLEGRSYVRSTLDSSDTDFLSCLAPLLAKARFACAAAAECVMDEHDTLP